METDALIIGGGIAGLTTAVALTREGLKCTVLEGTQSLGGRAAYIGKVSHDQLGEVFSHDIRALGVRFDTAPARGSASTATCLILAQRST